MSLPITDLVNSSVFCPAPWSNLDIDPRGIMSPCCKILNFPITNIETTTIAEYQQLPELAELKKELLAGSWPDGCIRCRREEAIGVQSKRQLDVERWAHIFQKFTVETLPTVSASIAVGNVCNLRCRTCNSESSSAWRADDHVIQRQVHPIAKFHNVTSTRNELVALVKTVSHIDFPGGEPFYTGYETQMMLLDALIANGRANEVTLHYTTNASVYPSQSFWDRWEHFKNVDIQLSVDGTKSHFEYIRHPASWPTVYRHIKQFQEVLKTKSNIQINISHTLSVFTVFYLPEFLIWCLREGLPKPWIGRVNTPAYYAPGIVPAASKPTVSAKLKHTEWANEVYNNDMSAHLAEFFEKTAALDAHRNQSFAATFPELYQLLKGTT